MVMQRWDPFREFRRMEEAMHRMERAFGLTDGGVETWSVPLDVVQDGDRVTVHATIPGVKPEDLEVTLEEGVLTIKGQTSHEHEKRNGSYLMRERRAGQFHRSIRLPDSVNMDEAQTAYENGVLTITFPKAESKKARKLEIRAA